jgi:predicted TIM-barrel fold metal-dependent hydrolase
MPSSGFEVPQGAVDCHHHIFDSRFPYSPTRRYTPPSATVADLQAFHAKIGISRTVIVQASVFGTDNRCMMDALKQLGENARGVAVIDRTFSASQLDDLSAGGVRGVRINLETGKDRDLNYAARRFDETVQQIAGRDWFIQVFAVMPIIEGLAARIMDQPHEIIIDHFGLLKAADGVAQEGLACLLSLMEAKKVYAKLSGAYMISKLKDYSDITPLARKLIETAPDRVIWGSNWPHTSGANRPANSLPTDIEPFRHEDDAYILGLVKDWAPDVTLRRKLLVDNPSRLFGFGK